MRPPSRGHQSEGPGSGSPIACVEITRITTLYPGSPHARVLPLTEAGGSVLPPPARKKEEDSTLINQIKAVPRVHHITFPGADIKGVGIGFIEPVKMDGGIRIAAQRIEIDFSRLRFNGLALKMQGTQSFIDLPKQDRIIWSDFAPAG